MLLSTLSLSIKDSPLLRAVEAQHVALWCPKVRGGPSCKVAIGVLGVGLFLFFTALSDSLMLRLDASHTLHLGIGACHLVGVRQCMYVPSKRRKEDNLRETGIFRRRP